MSALVNHLKLIRNAAAGLRPAAAASGQTAVLDAMHVLISDLIVAETQGAELQAKAATALGGDDYTRALKAATETVRGTADLKSLAPILRAERHYWLASGEAVAAEVKASAPAAPTETPTEAPFDTAALQTFLRKIPGEEAVEVVEANVVSRGMSKKTILVKLKGGKALPDEVAVRLDQQATNYLGTTVVDEWPSVSHLWKHGARIAQPFAIETTGKVLGAPFLVSAKVGGGPVGGNYVNPARNPALGKDVAACLARIHAAPVEGLPPSMPNDGKHIDREIDKSYANWRELDVDNPIMEAGFRWIRANQALGYGPAAMVHNDYNFNNILVDGDRVSAVVDWEFVHIGVPAADLGYIRYTADAIIGFDAFCQAYAEAGGVLPSKDQLDFYIFWGQLRLAVMAFQGGENVDGGGQTDIRFSIARQHRRIATERIAALLEQHGML